MLPSAKCTTTDREAAEELPISDGSAGGEEPVASSARSVVAVAWITNNKQVSARPVSSVENEDRPDGSMTFLEPRKHRQ
jgi:hypothetical protein